MARLARSSLRLQVVVATGGEGSHPRSPTWTRADLAGARRLETRTALDRLGLRHVPAQHLGLPDGGLQAEGTAVRRLLAPALDGAALVLAPWAHDGHPDHDEIGAACVELAGERVLAYAVWAWHWSSPDDGALPWHRARVVRLTLAERLARDHAVSGFTTQVHPLSASAGDEAVLPPEVRAHFERDVEVLFRG